MLINAIAKNLHKLLENRRLASIALLRERGAVVVMAVHITLVLVVGVLRPEDRRADAAGEVLDVVFAVQGRDVGAAQGATAVVAEEVQPFEVVGFAEGVLVWGVVGDGEEFGGDDFVAVLVYLSLVCLCGGFGCWGIVYMTGKTFQMIGVAQRAHKLACQLALAFTTDPLFVAGPPFLSGSLSGVCVARGI